MEEPVSFASGGSTLHGVWHAPGRGAAAPAAAVVFLHGWSGCRLGPHRMFVTAARRLCERGCACLRFDFRGRGESEGPTAEATIPSMISDGRAAVAWLRERRAADRVVLLGLCSGGKVAIGVAAEEPGIDGLALWSAEPMGGLKARGRESRKTLFALRDYARKLARPATWRKIVSGRVNAAMVRKAVAGHETSTPEEVRNESRILERFRAWRGAVLFVYGSNDPETNRAAANYAAFCRSAGIEHEGHEIAGANHSFYSLAWEDEVIGLTESWLSRFAGGA